MCFDDVLRSLPLISLPEARLVIEVRLILYTKLFILNSIINTLLCDKTIRLHIMSTSVSNFLKN